MCWKKSKRKSKEESMAEMKSFDNRGYMDTEGGGGSDYNANNKVSLLDLFLLFLDIKMIKTIFQQWVIEFSDLRLKCLLLS